MFQKKDLEDFSISNWYDTFKDVSLKTFIFEIHPELLQNLQQGNTDINIEEICTEEYVKQIKNAIKEFSNKAFVKNNWHAPMDAKVFSLGNTLEVTSIDDLILFLTVSDIIMNDFNSGKEIKHHIVLKPWISIHPASEFRCIVIKNILRGITPRDWPTYYAHFSEEGHNIITLLSDFFNANIKNKFIREDYVFDVVISYPDKPFIIDFGPLNNKTNLYAFKWPEVQSIIDKDSKEEVAPVFRYLDSDIGIMIKSDALQKFNLTS